MPDAGAANLAGVRQAGTRPGWRDWLVALGFFALAALTVFVHAEADAVAHMAVGDLVIGAGVALWMVASAAMRRTVAVIAGISGLVVAGAFDAAPAQIGAVVLMAGALAYRAAKPSRP